MTELKTRTLADEDGNPLLVTCEGHVSVEEFNEANGREWSERGSYTKDWIDHVYAKVLPEDLKENESWDYKKAFNGEYNKPMTVARWD